MVGDEGIASVPLEENEHPWFRCGAAGQPSAPGLEPVHPGAHPRELGESAAVQQPTLFSAPGHENGAPLHTAGETVPTPVGRAAHIAHLGLGHGHQVPIAAAQGNAIQQFVPQVIKLRGEQLLQLLFLVCVKAQLFRHLLGGLVGHGNDQHGDFCLHSRSLLTFGDFCAGLHAGGELVHLPEHLCKQPQLFLVHGGHVLALRVGGGLDSVDGQHLFPHCLAAGDFQAVVGMAGLEIFQLVLVLLVDLGNGSADGLACSGVLPGEENAEARAYQQPDQTNYHSYHHHHPASGKKSRRQGLGCGNGRFDGLGRDFGRLFCRTRGGLRLGPCRLHPPGRLLRGLGGSFRLSRCPLAGLNSGAAAPFRRLDGMGGGFHIPLGVRFDCRPLFTP